MKSFHRDAVVGRELDARAVCGDEVVPHWIVAWRFVEFVVRVASSFSSTGGAGRAGIAGRAGGAAGRAAVVTTIAGIRAAGVGIRIVVVVVSWRRPEVRVYSAEAVAVAVTVDDGQRIVAAGILRLDFEMFGNDGDRRRARNVDRPDAVEIVVVVAGIVEAGRRDDGVARSDGAAAFDDFCVRLGVFFVGTIRLVWNSRVFCLSRSCEGDE